MQNRNNKIIYLAHYNCSESLQNRYMAPSAVTKIDYILNVLSSLDKHTRLYSASSSLDKSYPATILEINDHITVRFFRSLRSKIRFLNRIFSLSFKLNLAFSLLREVSRDDTLIVYHSLYLMKTVSLIQKIKKCRLVIEAEEIYSDVLENDKTRQREVYFLQKADAYILPTSKLNEIVNVNNKPFVIVHGTYQEEYDRKCRNDVWAEHSANPNDIHCVYAGTLDPRKGGALAAVNAAMFLPENYHMHILGFGLDEDIQRINKVITETASKSKARITYDGTLSGEDYIRFIQSCDIGLSTQIPTAAFNDTSFPSKVLSYLANGLKVVSIRIPVIEGSDVWDLIYYYDEQTPENIAKAISQVKLQEKIDSKARVLELDNKFKKDIDELLSILDKP